MWPLLEAHIHNLSVNGAALIRMRGLFEAQLLEKMRYLNNFFELCTIAMGNVGNEY